VSLHHRGSSGRVRCSTRSLPAAISGRRSNGFMRTMGAQPRRGWHDRRSLPAADLEREIDRLQDRLLRQCYPAISSLPRSPSRNGPAAPGGSAFPQFATALLRRPWISSSARFRGRIRGL